MLLLHHLLLQLQLLLVGRVSFRERLWKESWGDKDGKVEKALDRNKAIWEESKGWDRTYRFIRWTKHYHKTTRNTHTWENVILKGEPHIEKEGKGNGSYDYVRRRCVQASGTQHDIEKE